MSKSIFYSLGLHVVLLVGAIFAYSVFSLRAHSTNTALENAPIQVALYRLPAPNQIEVDNQMPKDNINAEVNDSVNENIDENALENTIDNPAEIANIEPVLQEQPKPIKKAAAKPEEKSKPTQKQTQKQTAKKSAAPAKSSAQSSNVNAPQTANTSLAATNKNATSQRAKPLQRNQPQYPRRALDRKIEGYVIVQFDVNAQGAPENIKIIEAKPKNLFDKETIQAIKTWRYEKIASKNIEIKIEFKRSGQIQMR